MTELARTVITAIANKAEAISMSVVNGQAQFSFAGNATTTQGSASPTHCLSSGTVDESIITAYLADPRFFVSEHAGSEWPAALVEHDPRLWQWFDPNEEI